MLYITILIHMDTVNEEVYLGRDSWNELIIFTEHTWVGETDV